MMTWSGQMLTDRGFQFTQKLEGMFTDMRLSAEGANALRNYLAKKNIVRATLAPSIPSHQIPLAALPPRPSLPSPCKGD